MNTANATSVREDMRAAEARIRRALTAPSAGERIDALMRAYSHLDPGARDPFVASLIGRVVFDCAVSPEASSPSA
jgi:hypothetical protein